MEEALLYDISIDEDNKVTYDHFNEKEMVYLGQERDLTYYSIKRD